MNNSWLSECSTDESIPTYTSQRGEDRIIANIFEIIKEKNRWCVEFGAADGKRGSNTWHWINNKGWYSVQIEPKRDTNLNITQRRDSFDALLERYGDSDRVTCLNRFVQPHGEHTLDNILANTAVPKEFDLLSIDIDGDDYRVWESVQTYRPRVVIIEHNKTIPIDVDFYSSQGSSLFALARLGKQKGYELVAATDLNGIFVIKDHFQDMDIKDNSPEQIWTGHHEYVNRVWQLFDGTVVFRGNNKLRWTHGADRTISGQLKAGSFLWIDPKDTTIISSDRPTSVLVAPLISGRARTWLYSIMRRI